MRKVLSYPWAKPRAGRTNNTSRNEATSNKGQALALWIGAFVALAGNLAVLINGQYELKLEREKSKSQITLELSKHKHELNQYYLEKAINPNNELTYRLAILRFLTTTATAHHLAAWAEQEEKLLEPLLLLQNKRGSAETELNDAIADLDNLKKSGAPRPEILKAEKRMKDAYAQLYSLERQIDKARLDASILGKSLDADGHDKRAVQVWFEDGKCCIGYQNRTTCGYSIEDGLIACGPKEDFLAPSSDDESN